MLSTIASPPMSEEFYAELIRAFPVKQVHVSTRIEEVMFAAGEQHVLRWVSARLRREHKTVSVTPEVRVQSTKYRVQGAWKRLKERVHVAVAVMRGKYDSTENE